MTRGFIAAVVLLALTACQTPPRGPMETVSYVDVDRFMGDWYVIASIPTPFETDAFDAVERYVRRDGYIETTFIFRRGGSEGPEKRMHAKGFVQDTQTNARWGMQFIWPFKADYRVIYLDDGYRTTIIGREARDYVWIMARDPRMSEEVLAQHRAWLALRGYDVTKLVTIAHAPGAQAFVTPSPSPPSTSSTAPVVH